MMFFTTSFFNRIGLSLLVTVIVSLQVLGQSPPNNLTIDHENNLMKLEGLNTSSFYDEDVLESIYLEFEQTDFWQSLKDSYDTENYVMGTMTYKGVVLDSIGAQFKGNTSYTKVTNDAKYSFALALDEFIDGQDIEGYNTLNLNNAYQDASFMREVLYNHLNRCNIPGAKGNFVKLYINGEYWGVYTNIQQLNKDFTKEWFMTNNGSLWRGDAPSTSTEDDADTGDSTTPGGVRPGGNKPGGGGVNAQWGDGTTALNYLGADTSLYQKYYTLKHSSQDNPWDLLMILTDKLNNTDDVDLLDSISKYLDIDKTLWFLAHETVFCDDDSYIMKGRQDFYVYYEPETELITPLEFDGNSALDTKNINWSMFYNEENENFPLMNKLYAIPELRQRYLAHTRTIIDELLDVELTDSLIDKYDALISSSVESDPKNMYSFIEYESSMEELRSFFGERKSILLSNSEVNEVGLEISLVEHSVNEVVSASPSENESVDVSAFVSGSKSTGKVYLYYASYYVGSFTKVEMYDDGIHHDGIAEDGVYGGEIPGFANGDYVRYYIEAIANDDARTASYSPVGAEHDVYFYRVGVPATAISDVVINEICASNATISQDNDGEYDDWIELYNNSDEAISLSGYYLTDDVAELSKWAFPDLTIAANSYLIIWADKNVEQGTYHANFKLSASGEELYLINSNAQIADQVWFGTQETDVTYGRSPNGTGDFMLMLPSYKSVNTVGIINSVNVNVEGGSVRIYPNPAKDYVQIETKENTNVMFYLYDIQGELISQHKIHSTLSVDLRNVNKGLYIVRIEGSESTYVDKLLLK